MITGLRDIQFVDMVNGLKSLIKYYKERQRPNEREILDLVKFSLLMPNDYQRITVVEWRSRNSIIIYLVNLRIYLKANFSHSHYHPIAFSFIDNTVRQGYRRVYASEKPRDLNIDDRTYSRYLCSLGTRGWKRNRLNREVFMIKLEEILRPVKE